MTEATKSLTDETSSLFSEDIHIIEDVVISIDVGVRNCAFAIIKIFDNSVIGWQNTSLLDSQEKTTPDTISRSVHSFVNDLIALVADEGCRIAKVIVEDQMKFRPTARNHMTFYANGIVSTAIISHFIARNIECSMCVPKKVSNYFSILGRNSREKKKLTCNLIKEMIAKNEIIFRYPSLKETFLASRKKDDMADCMLQALYINSQLNM